MSDFHSTVESVFRSESGRIVASLIRYSRSFDLAEEAMQEAFTIAISHWQSEGVPHNPAAWITAVASRRLIDALRREHTRRRKEDQLAYEAESWTRPNLDGEEPMPSPLEDERLRLLFTCCHPAINREAQIALTLRTLGGLTTAEIARAFLIPEPTLAQRLVRAKRKIQDARIPYAVPRADCLPSRLTAVQAVLYLIFNEGYLSSFGSSLVRWQLCSEAIRLARTLNELISGNPENMGLLSLMLLHDSRRDARCNTEGELVLLEEQDRLLWHHDQIEEGTRILEQALARRNPGPYQIQAAIVAVHAEAKHSIDTDWKQIAALYSALGEFQPSPVVALNHAVAVAMAGNLERAFELLESAASSGQLSEYYLYYAARADLLRRMQRNTDALETYQRAMSLASNEVERCFLSRRMKEVEDQLHAKV